MSRKALIVDTVLVAILTVLVVVVSPGLAFAGLIAVLLVLICLVSFAIDGLRRRLRQRRGRPELRRPSSRPPEPLGRPSSRPPTRSRRPR